MNQQKETKIQKTISTVSLLLFVFLMASMLWGDTSYAATVKTLPTLTSYTASTSNLYSNQYQSSTTTAISTSSVFSAASIKLSEYVRCPPITATTPIPAAGFLFAPIALALTRVKRKIKG
jgi:hypothetical protein